MRTGDRIIVAAVLALAAAAWPAALLATGGLEPASTVVVTGPTSTQTVPLAGDRTLRVHGVRGIVDVVVRDGAVRVSDSDCPDRLCVEQGAIRTGAIVCLPNGVTVKVGGGEDQLDAYVR